MTRRRMSDADERTQIATAAYDALKSTGELGSHRVLSYRCPRRCLLLEVLRFPQGLVFASPRYKLSPSLNEKESVPQARAVRTEDGDRRWKPSVYFAQDAANASVTCDHVRPTVIPMERVNTDLEERTPEVVWHA